jgi:hypothetical protein
VATFDEEFIRAQDLAVGVAPEYAKYIRWWVPYARPGIGHLHIAESRNFYYDPAMPAEMIAAELIHLSHHIKMRHGKRGEAKANEVTAHGEQFWASLWRISTCLETVEAWSDRVEGAGLQWAPGTDLREQIKPPKRMKAEEIYDWLDKSLSEEEKEQLEQGGQGQSEEERQQGQQGQQGEGQPGEGQPGQGQPGQGQPGQGQPGQGQPGQGQPGQGQPGQGQPGQGQPGQGQPGQGEGQPGDLTDGNGGMCRLEDYDLDEDEVEQGVGNEGQGQEGEGQEGEGQGQDGQGQEGEGQDGQPGDGQGQEGQPSRAPQAGSQDAEIDREADPRRRREIMWMKIVKKLMSGNELEDYGMQPPSNRSPDPLLLPELQEAPETIGILIDVSSSVNEAQLQVFVELAATIHRRISDIKVALGNTKVTKTGRVQLLGKIKGEGGTSFEKVIPEAYKKLGKPTRFLVITDGETKWPSTLPPNTTIVVLNDKDVVNEGSYKQPPNVRKRTLWVRFKDLAAPDVKKEVGIGL